MLPDIYIELSRALESAYFDYIIIEDFLMIADTYRGTMEYALAHAQTAPKNESSRRPQASPSAAPAPSSTHGTAQRQRWRARPQRCPTR